MQTVFECDSDNINHTDNQETIETTIVQSSSSNDIRNQFISTLDHFVCKLIRSLWIIQHLNIESRNDINNKNNTACLKEQQAYNESLQLQQIVQREYQAVQTRLTEIKQYEKVLKKYNKIKDDESENDTGHKTNRKRRRDSKPVDITVELKSTMGGNNHSNKKKYKPNSVNSLVTHKKYITVSHIADKNNFNKKQINKIIKNTINSSTSREDDDNRLYCICKKPSEGRMIACDNQNCKIEWFHYKCVKISRAPRTQWFCSKKCKDEYKSKKK